MYIYLQILLFRPSYLVFPKNGFLYKKRLFESVKYLFTPVFEVPNNIFLGENSDVATNVEIYECHRSSWYKITSRNVHFTKKLQFP